MTNAEYVDQSMLNPGFHSAYLANEDDVDAYVKALRSSLIEAIQSGKRIYV